MLCFTAEDIWKFIPATEGSVHLARLPEVDSALQDDELAERWQKLRDLRKLVTKSAEARRASFKIALAALVGLALGLTLALFLEVRRQPTPAG